MTDFGKRTCQRCRGVYFTWHTYTNDIYCRDCAEASRHAGAPKPCPDVSSQPQPVSHRPVGPDHG